MTDLDSVSGDEVAMERTADQIAAEQAAEENARLLNFLYACPVGLVEISSDGTIDMMNPVAMQLLMRLSPSPPANLFEVTTSHAPELRNLLVDFKPSQGTVCENHRILVRTGQEDAELEVLSCTLVKLGPERYVVSLSDISNQVRQERKLKEAESWFSSLLEGASEFGVASLDLSGRIASVSASLSRQTGFSDYELIGQNMDFLEAACGPHELPVAEKQLAVATREGWSLNEGWHRHHDGSTGWYQRLVAVRHDTAETEQISGFTVILREGQQRAVDARRLKEMLTRDHLTGACNRMHFFELAERECVRSRRFLQPLSLVITDIDLFKRINDSYGHPAGDEVLKQFTQVCLSLLRPSDALARIGGEEFAVLLPGTGLDGATHFAERLRRAISEAHIEAQGARISITASFGCAKLSDQGDLAAMMEVADGALYEAKRAGRNCVVAKHIGR